MLCLGMAFTNGSAATAEEGGAADEKIVISVDNDHGSFTAGSGNFRSEWTATGTPALTLSCGTTNNMKQSNSGTNLELYTGTANSSTYTLAVPSGYVIEGYSFKFAGSDAAVNCTVTPAGGTAVVSSASAEQTVSVSGLSTQSTAFTVSDNANKAAVTKDFTVTVSRVEEDSRIFIPTTVTDGQFAPKTVWYTLQIGTAGQFISDNGEADRITLSRVYTELEDEDLWCFAGDAENGYRIYNKAAGAGKVLASNTTMSAISGVGGTGGSTYPTLQDPNALPDGYVDRWDFRASNKINLEDVEGQFIFLHGTNYALNNFASRGDLAFWAEGQDAGSTVAIRFAETTIPIVKSEGTMTEGSMASANFFATWTYGGTPELTISSGDANNMQKAGDEFMIASGRTGNCTYIFQTGTQYAIAGYTFDFAAANADATISITPTNEETVTSTNSEWKNITVNGLMENTATFAMTGTNTNVMLNNFNVTIHRFIEGLDKSKTIVFNYGGDRDHNVVYRIPAIATVGTTGRLIAINDYRYCGADIGNGRIDLHISVSDDNGATWTEPDLCRDANGNAVTQGDGQGTLATANENRDCGFGDAAIVGDSESSRVLMLSVCGRTPFFSATRQTPNAVARWYSEDGGDTWTQFEDITEQIYSLFDGTVPYGYIDSMFFGSGRIAQSSRVKVGKYYRLYAVMSGRNVVAGNISNWVMYSDDFGQNWAILGDPMTPPVPASADEPKAEELPDGSVICSSRVGGGRWYNIFNYTDIAKAEGTWGNCTKSTLVQASGNACNGEIMVLPVEKKATGEKMYLALQSIPFGPARSHVGINFKELNGYEDYGTVENFAADWDGAYEVTALDAAYSTMSWQHDNKLAFLYEEATYGKGYCGVYKSLSIEQITDSVYSYCADTDNAVANALTKSIAERKVNAIKEIPANGYVGQLTEDGLASIETALADYIATPSVANNVALNAAIANAETIGIKAGLMYRLRNYGRANNRYLQALSNEMSVGDLNETNKDQLFAFMPGEEDGTWTILNENRNVYIGSTGAQNTKIPMVGEANAALYKVNSLKEGLSALLCQSPATAVYPAIHLDGSLKLVPWSASSTSNDPASFWYIEPTEFTITDIDEIATETPAEKTVYYDLQGRRVMKLIPGSIYVTNDRRKVFVK